MKIEISRVKTLEDFCNRLSNEILSPKLAYKIAKLAIVLAEEAQFYQAQCQKYLNKYALIENNDFVFTENGNIKIITGLEKECKEKFNELDSIMIDTGDFELTFRDIQELKVTVAEMTILMPFIKEPLRGE